MYISFQVNLQLLFQVFTSPKHLYLWFLQLVYPAPLFPEPFSKISSFSCSSDSVTNYIAFSFIVSWYCPSIKLPGPYFSCLSFLIYPVLPTEAVAQSIFTFLHSLLLSLLSYLSHTLPLPYNVSIHYQYCYSTYQVWPSDHWYCCQMVLWWETE